MADKTETKQAEHPNFAVLSELKAKADEAKAKEAKAKAKAE